MDITQRIAKAARETDEVRHHEPEAIARAVMATLFNWMSEPSDRALDAGVIGAHQDADTCRRVWSAMLAELRREAGF